MWCLTIDAVTCCNSRGGWPSGSHLWTAAMEPARARTSGVPFTPCVHPPKTSCHGKPFNNRACGRFLSSVMASVRCLPCGYTSIIDMAIVCLK